MMWLVKIIYYVAYPYKMVKDHFRYKKRLAKLRESDPFRYDGLD